MSAARLRTTRRRRVPPGWLLTRLHRVAVVLPILTGTALVFAGEHPVWAWVGFVVGVVVLYAVPTQAAAERKRRRPRRGRHRLAPISALRRADPPGGIAEWIGERTSDDLSGPADVTVPTLAPVVRPAHKRYGDRMRVPTPG